MIVVSSCCSCIRSIQINKITFYTAQLVQGRLLDRRLVDCVMRVLPSYIFFLACRLAADAADETADDADGEQKQSNQDANAQRTLEECDQCAF